MHILVTGSHGQLGNELRRCLETGTAEIDAIDEEYENALVDYTDTSELNIADNNEVEAWFNSHEPYDIVFNCAAITNVDGCEANYELAKSVNADAVAYLAWQCTLTGAKFVHVSTDYVFPGTDAVPRVETDETGPISAYGKSKLSGEEAALSHAAQVFIIRTAWLYGYVGKNFVKTMRNLGQNHDEVTVVDDQLGNPTSANDLAYEMLEIALTDNYGIYHCTNEGICSWADFAQAIMESFNLDCKVKRCTSKEYKEMNPQSADRPAYSSLQNKHLEDTIGNKMRTWQEALQSFVKNLNELEG